MAGDGLVGTHTVNRGAPADLMDRLCVFSVGSPARTASPVPVEGYLIKQADVSSISVKGWYDGEQVGTTQTPAVSSVIYDTIQTSAAWGRITGGGNAHYQAPAELFDVTPVDDELIVVRIQIELTMADATKIEWLWDITVNQATA